MSHFVCMCISPVCPSVIHSSRALCFLFLTAVVSTIRPALSLPCNVKSYTKVNKFILCLKYVSLRLCKAAHRHSRVGLKEHRLINERERETEKESVKETETLSSTVLLQTNTSYGTPLFGLRHHG